MASVMGIQGLLPALKSIMTPGYIRDHAGKRAALDTYSCLHKACKDICEGWPTEKYIGYCLHRVNLLHEHGVVLLHVFGADVLPMKAEEEVKNARL